MRKTILLVLGGQSARASNETQTGVTSDLLYSSDLSDHIYSQIMSSDTESLETSYISNITWCDYGMETSIQISVKDLCNETIPMEEFNFEEYDGLNTTSSVGPDTIVSYLNRSRSARDDSVCTYSKIMDPGECITEGGFYRMDNYTSYDQGIRGMWYKTNKGNLQELGIGQESESRYPWYTLKNFTIPQSSSSSKVSCLTALDFYIEEGRYYSSYSLLVSDIVFQYRELDSFGSENCLPKPEFTKAPFNSEILTEVVEEQKDDDDYEQIYQIQSKYSTYYRYTQQLEYEIQRVLNETGNGENYLQFSQAIKNETSLLGAKDLAHKDKIELVSQLVDPLSRKIRNISGKEYVRTMSDDAVDYFLDFAGYYHQYGNFTSLMYSNQWAQSEPLEQIDIYKTSWCALQKGSCSCPFGSKVHFGAKTQDGDLDLTKNYHTSKAHFSGSTRCKNSVFGDPLPGESKNCFCEEIDVEKVGPQFTICGFDGQPCECEEGSVVAYSSFKFREDGEIVIDNNKTSKAETVGPTGEIQCSKDAFGGAEGDSCFCGNGTIDTFCDWKQGYELDLGCYQDSQVDRDFEELLSSEVDSIEACLKLAFDNYMSYAGLQMGTQCWGSTEPVGKYGRSDECEYKCPSGEQCGGQDANSIYKFAYTKKPFCSSN